MRTLKRHARSLASYGRFGDSLLVHMAPEEVAGLSTLAHAAGTELTTNPHTGLPEAFKLRDLMTYAVPVAAGVLGGPLLGGAVSGGVNYAQNGDLSKALLSGATGAAIGSMFSGAPTDAAVQGAGDAAISGPVSNATNTLGADGWMAGVGDGSVGAVGLDALPATSADAAVSGASAGNPSLWSQKMAQLQNTDWSANGGPIFNVSGGVRMAPIIAGGGLLGLAGIQDQENAADAWRKDQERQKQHSRDQFNYYQSMAHSGPANLIPAYRG